MESELAPRDRPRWWTDIFDDNMELELEMGGKLVLLEKILRHCERVNDKLYLMHFIILIMTFYDTNYVNFRLNYVSDQSNEKFKHLNVN